MSTNDGGPAFPCHNDSNKEYYWIKQGMTLRDWFAGMALNAQITQWERWNRKENGQSPSDRLAILIAEDCYDIADAMLAARDGKEEA